MNRLTIATQYFENRLMLRRQQQEWAAYPPEVRAKLHVVLVDDASPEHPAAEALIEPEGYTLELYRMRENIPWGQNRARNRAPRFAAKEMTA